MPDREKLIEAVQKAAKKVCDAVLHYEVGTGTANWNELVIARSKLMVALGALAALPAAPVRATDPARAAAEALVSAIDDFFDPKIRVGPVWPRAQDLRAALVADREPEPVQFSDDQRFAVACALRDWIHKQPWSECDMGADTCPDWPKAYEIRDVVLAALSEPNEAGESDE